MRAHCLASSADGGENTLVDSFRVARDLPRDDLEVLARTPASTTSACSTASAYAAERDGAPLRLSLELQGGPYTPEEVADFESSPHAADAVHLRRYDDVGKMPGLETPDLEHYRSVLLASIRA